MSNLHFFLKCNFFLQRTILKLCLKLTRSFNPNNTFQSFLYDFFFPDCFSDQEVDNLAFVLETYYFDLGEALNYTIEVLNMIKNHAATYRPSPQEYSC